MFKEKTQLLANITVDWFIQNDMVVSGDKTNLLILGTRVNRKLKVEDNNYLNTEKMGMSS